MRDWHMGSFTWDNHFDTPFLHKLDEFYFSDMHSMSKERAEFFESMRNMLVKYGFMQYSKDLLKNTIQGKQIETSYYLTNFITYTKAFIDGIAIVLNHFYKLNRTGGEIDLKHNRFIAEIKSKDSTLGSFLENNYQWIEDVVSKRDDVIHRKSPLYVHRNTGLDKQDEVQIVKMTMEPIAFFDTDFERDNKIIQKYGKLEQDIIEFCENWLKNGKEMIENLSASLYRNLSSET